MCQSHFPARYHTDSLFFEWEYHHITADATSSKMWWWLYSPTNTMMEKKRLYSLQQGSHYHILTPFVKTYLLFYLSCVSHLYFCYCCALQNRIYKVTTTNKYWWATFKVGSHIVVITRSNLVRLLDSLVGWKPNFCITAWIRADCSYTKDLVQLVVYKGCRKKLAVMKITTNYSFILILNQEMC